MEEKDDVIYIPESERFEYTQALSILLKFSEFGVPLPIIFGELYVGRRLVLYASKVMAEKFVKTISSFLFYQELDVVFCSDETFQFKGEECNCWFINIDKQKFLENDFFFALDLECKKSVIEFVKAKKVKGMTVESFRKPYMGSLLHYIRCIRPLKNFLANHSNVQVLMVDNFTAPKGELTEWEKEIKENGLTREKVVEHLRNGEYPFPPGLYTKEYTATDIVQMHIIPERSYDENGVFRLKDCESKYVNVRNGVRKTTNQPKNHKRILHIFGGCGLFGVGHPDDATMASCLQQMLNEDAMEYGIKVENHASFIWDKHDVMWYSVNDVKYGDNDIVVIPFNPKWASSFYRNAPNVFYVDMTVRTPEDGEIFNDAWHPSANGLKVYARNIFNFLKSKSFLTEIMSQDKKFTRIMLPRQYGIPAFANSKMVSSSLLSDENMRQLNGYISEISQYRRKNGAIVMNCNPFTLGHRYLIEYASKQVDWLYIFAVEEDKSFFPFADRIELIKQGTADLSNVTVLPSGQFIISALTFTDYFGKKELQDKIIDPSLDVSIFGKYIAPSLGITVRFAGEEPLDKVTLQYNNAMSEILPQYGMEFVVIPRKESDGEVISASRVRKLLEEQTFEGIKRIVPNTTYQYLIKKFGHH